MHAFAIDENAMHMVNECIMQIHIAELSCVEFMLNNMLFVCNIVIALNVMMVNDDENNKPAFDLFNIHISGRHKSQVIISEAL